jgi:hypothetical protein
MPFSSASILWSRKKTVYQTWSVGPSVHSIPLSWEMQPQKTTYKCRRSREPLVAIGSRLPCYKSSLWAASVVRSTMHLSPRVSIIAEAQSTKTSGAIMRNPPTDSATLKVTIATIRHIRPTRTTMTILGTRHASQGETSYLSCLSERRLFVACSCWDVTVTNSAYMVCDMSVAHTNKFIAFTSST